MARMSETFRTLFSGDGSFSDRMIDFLDDLVDPARASKNPFKRAFIFEPLEERIALNVAPVFVDLPDEITVIAGDSFHLALNGSDEDGDALTFSTSSNLASVLTANQTNDEGEFIRDENGDILQRENYSIRIRIVERDEAGNITRDFGFITIELFENDAPLTTARIKEIVESEFYDGKLFHRIMDGFMIQGGSASGTGNDGTGTTFDDEFSNLLRHNSQGIVSMANSGENTNDSQFFITDAATIWLDDVHSIFGFLTSGYDVLEEVSKVETTSSSANPANRPLLNISMEDVELITDTENGVLRIQADVSMAGTTQEITVMVDDGNGGQLEKTIKVNVAPKAADLEFDEAEIAEMKAGQSIIVDMPGLANIPSDQIKYYLKAYEGSHPDMQYEVTDDFRLKITAGRDVSGPQYVWIAAEEVLDGWVRNISGVYMLVVVTPAAPELSWTGGDNGAEDDGITSHNNKDEDTTLTFTVAHVVPGAIIELYANGVRMPFEIISDTFYDDAGNVVASNSPDIAYRTLVIETIGIAENKLNDGTFNFTVMQSHTPGGFAVSLDSELSTPVKVIVATVAPEFVSPSNGFVYDVSPGETLTVNVSTNKDDADDITITLEDDAPEGMTLSQDGKTVTWTPADDIEVGDYTFTLKLTDGAGNTRTTTCTVAVQDGPKFVIDGSTTVDEGSTMMFDLLPEDDVPDGKLIFEIENSTLPEDANVSLIAGDDERSALFMWTTTEEDGPGHYTITFKVTDEDGNTRRKMIQLSVNEANSAPYFDAEDFEEEYVVNEHEELVIDVKARDDDIPKNSLNYQLIGDNIPDGMTIDETTGKLTWTPGELYGSQMYNITVEVTDEGGLSAQYTIKVVIVETDDPPVFTEVDPISIFDDYGELKWDMEAADPDVPTNDVIKYSLVGENIPDGMTINETTGEIIWAIPTGYVSEDVEYLELNIEVKATEIINSLQENEEGEMEPVATDGEASIYTVTLKIYSRAYEAKQKELQQEAEKQRSLASRFGRSEYDIPGLPGAGFNPLLLRDMPGSNAHFNTHRANGRVESPMHNPHVDTRFRDRFDTVTFGIDSLGNLEELTDTEKQDTSQNNETLQPPSQPQESSDGHRSRRPVSPGAIMRGIEGGMSRFTTPLLDTINDDVAKAVAEAHEAGQAVNSYYQSLQTTQPMHTSNDSVMRNWGGVSSDQQSSTTPGYQNTREQFNRGRLRRE